jgi:hypothetical protein
MSNPLYVTLTEFKTRGTDEMLCGYVANDNDSESVYRVASTWEAFKAQFPTRESIMQQICGSGVFVGLEEAYQVIGDEIVAIGADDDDSFSGAHAYSDIYFEGDSGLY